MLKVLARTQGIFRVSDLLFLFTVFPQTKDMFLFLNCVLMSFIDGSAFQQGKRTGLVT